MTKVAKESKLSYVEKVMKACEANGNKFTSRASIKTFLAANFGFNGSPAEKHCLKVALTKFEKKGDKFRKPKDMGVNKAKMAEKKAKMAEKKAASKAKLAAKNKSKRVMGSYIRKTVGVKKRR